MSIFEVTITLFPDNARICTLTISNSDGVSIQSVEAEEALMWIGLILTSDGELSMKHNIFNPDIVYIHVRGEYDVRE